MADVTYTKLRDGSWGIRSRVPLRVGQTVRVGTKSGVFKTESVRKVIWSGNGITLASIVRDEPSQDSDTVRCRHCGKRTAEGDDWCQMCGKADYE